MRTGNAILDVIIEVAVIAIAAAIINWILSVIGAPSIILTIIWILALVAILLVLLQLLTGAGGFVGGMRRPGRRPPP
jgi:hypothetical protein